MRVFSILDQIQWFEHVAGITADERQESDQSRQHEDVIVRQIQLSNDVVNGRLGFGLPPGADVDHRKDNMEGGWARIILPDAKQGNIGDATEVVHNLSYPLADGSHQVLPNVPSVNHIPNVRWFTVMIWHDGEPDGEGLDANSVISTPIYQPGDNITPDFIELRVFACGNRVVDADHPIIIDLFFIPAEQ